MEKQFFKQLLQKLDPRFNKDTTSHMSFTMWLQGWVTSVTVKLKCSAVTLYLCHRCGTTVKLYCCCTQSGSVWPVTAANWEIWFLHLLNAAAHKLQAPQRLFLSSQILLLHILRVSPTPRVHAVCDRLCRRASGDPSAGWPALTPADLPRLRLTLWPA